MAGTKDAKSSEQKILTALSVTAQIISFFLCIKYEHQESSRELFHPRPLTHRASVSTQLWKRGAIHLWPGKQRKLLTTDLVLLSQIFKPQKGPHTSPSLVHLSTPLPSGSGGAQAEWSWYCLFVPFCAKEMGEKRPHFSSNNYLWAEFQAIGKECGRKRILPFSPLLSPLPLGRLHS